MYVGVGTIPTYLQLYTNSYLIIVLLSFSKMFLRRETRCHDKNGSHSPHPTKTCRRSKRAKCMHNLIEFVDRDLTTGPTSTTSTSPSHSNYEAVIDIHRIYGFGDDGEGRGITCRARRDREEHRRFDDLVSDGDGSNGDDGGA